MLVVAQPRQPRLHAVEGGAFAEPLPLLTTPGLGLDKLLGAGTDFVGRQQFANREDPRVFEVGGGPLIGDGELRQAVDLVAPEIDTNRMVGGARIDIDDRAANRQIGRASCREREKMSRVSE